MEIRIPGADANFYLAIAAIVASGAYGIQHDLPLMEAATSNLRDYEKIASDLKAATIMMQQSPIPKELFGCDFVRHYAATRLWECHLHDLQVSDWERKRYMETV
jgi:glutamine synthetase